MNNGEGTRGGNVSKVASPDPSDSFPPTKSDGGDLSPISLSRYSSCGESEFERYCSANSVMGTPSMRSSFGGSTFNDCLDSEFGSFKSLGFGDDLSFENFSLGGNGKLPTLGDIRIDGDMKVTSGFSGLRLYDDNSNEGSSDVKISSSEMVSENEVRLGGSVKNVSTRGSGKRNLVEEGSLFCADSEENCLDGMDLHLGSEFDGRDMEGEEDGTSSRYEHSEGEDSMYNYGSDDEHRSNSYYPRNVDHIHEAERKNENPLLINSQVAFGSDDWDDFEQEVGGSTLSSLTLGKLQEKRELNPKSTSNLSNLTYVTPKGFTNDGQKEQRNDVTDLCVVNKKVQGANQCKENINHSTMVPADLSYSGESKHVEDVKDIPLASCQVQGTDVLAENTTSSSATPIGLSAGPEQTISYISITSNQVQESNDVRRNLNNCSIRDVFEKHQYVNTEKVISTDDSGHFKNQELGYFNRQLDPLDDISTDQLFSDSTGYRIKLNTDSSEDHEPKLPPSTSGNIVNASKHSPASADLFEDHPATTKRENLELNNFYDEVVHEMEEILLDYSESPGARLSQGHQLFQSHSSLPLRDGGSTASTSGTDDGYPLTLHPLRIDRVEVVGARQKKGDVSLSERLVGVKEYTVYIIEVWSGKDRWQVERRYRDFFTLYRRLKSLFVDQGWILPSPWSYVEKESRKIFGNASPDVVAERSILIQACLQSILHSNYFSSSPSALIWFLSPQKSLPTSPASNTSMSQSAFFSRGADAESISTFGKTISLIVEIRAHKSVKQMLEAQHYACAGCHKYFDDGMTLMRDFVQTFGWGKPRLCEYTGQLFCSSCHTNETAVLPARVLHHWDFTQYPVSQMAKSYLDSVHDQPMLCVSAVNPFLFSKVPALHQVMGVRKKIGTMLPYVRCPFRKSINKGLGSRRYLLEGNDFFALRDLIDLSKGPFAALPVMVANVSSKILEHITEQCLICCDVGVPCSARQACNDPSSLIFAFQEDEVDRCTSCKAVFHKLCIKKLTYCPCGAPLGVDEAVSSTKKGSDGASGKGNGVILKSPVKRAGSGLSIGLLSGLFSKIKPEKLDRKDSDTVILMGSLPNTTL